jgi:DNA invertase Pin-like site-specific DNA recombinase
VLLSFAQFEREVTSERIRDKIAASKRKGLWVGGIAPLGYETKDRKIVVVEDEAERVRPGQAVLQPVREKDLRPDCKGGCAV